ncbi:metal-dependent hydrolase [Alteribacter aurantiacus]|uniref:metal-dependent hydrolase n=1 Tax=Alteribacter aurantiacus TaxID=254410 RepID=UPI00047E4C88|nr:metal-dependent hydrolase [Alteribacter aurantiacus]
MRYDTHLAMTMAVGSGLSYFQQDTTFTALYIGGLVLGSLLPDIDEPSSFIGRRLPFFSRPVKRLFGHRGITHSVLSWLLLVYVLSSYTNLFVLGLVTGYGVHLLGDLFSKRSIPLLAPLSGFRLKMPITYKSSGLFENTVLFISVIVTIYYFFQGSLLEELLKNIGI